MKNLALSVTFLLFTQTAFATSLENCLNEASKFTPFRKDTKYRECIQYAANVDDCITIFSKLTRLSQDTFLRDQCLPLSKTREECIRAADHGFALNDDDLDYCRKRFQ